ncbi:MAG: DPP IV N-terminal domain-containing protein [Pyrinomonadaceae bacterium]|nr:DPP IV N-terminal domain-containing protein [Pyrinomonadaceae bacterium]
MKKINSIILPDARRIVFIAGMMGIILAGFLVLTKSAVMQSGLPTISDLTAQPDTLGRLAFQRLNIFNSGSASVSLLAVNADGTGLTTLAGAGTPPLFCGEPTFSPDGARIVYVTDSDIYVMNADGSNKINITSNGLAIVEGNPSWSATNKIAYERASQIWTMNADGSNQTRFSAITQPSPITPAWSPDGSKMAFGSGGEIWVINADGTGERRVTNNATTDADPQWSPDGAKIIFGKGGGIAVINLDGTGETNLTNGANDGKPSWSSDGTKIAFVRRDGANGGIFTMDANGANQSRLVADQLSQPGRNENDNPAWQPVPAAPNTFIIGGRITRDGIGLNNVTVNLTGATATATVTTNALGFYQFGNLPGGGSYTLTPSLVNVTFTPPNQTFTNLSSNQTTDFTATGGSGFCQGAFCYSNGKIAHYFNFGAANFRVATINPDGTGQTIITQTSNDSEPSYSPDGARIVFVRSSPAGIYRVNADGSGIIQLTTVNDTYPSYSPDGESIAFVRNQRIFKMNADGTNQTQMTTQAGDNEPAFSPNGSKIAFTRGNTIYTMNADGANQTQLITASSSMPSYSPDGRNIVYLGAGGIFVMNADGTNQVLIRVGNIRPSYSPDGTKILYTNRDFVGASPRVYTMNTDGSGSGSITFGFTADWQPIRQLRRTEFDFDGDLKADVSVFRPSNGFWYRLNSQNNSFAAAQFGISTDKLAPADYDGDGKTDIAVFREGALGYFYIFNSSTNTFRFEQFGTTGDAPIAGDWDGDGRSDLAVYRSGQTAGAQSNFYYRPTAAPNVDFRVIVWGTNGDKPLVGDFDGDGKLDAAVFRPANATWYVLKSADNQLQFAQFGIASDIPTAADFNGDGKTDYAVFRPSTGTWFTSQNPATNYGAIQFGANGDSPVPADYDGDGRADVAVFRNGTWYLNRSQAGFTGVAFGSAGDRPVPNALVP